MAQLDEFEECKGLQGIQQSTEEVSWKKMTVSDSDL
jgi:hypothetical protein